ncbi:MAG: PEP/pyruvate-binding domain-containing protein [Verrucomicrobiota bacterium]|nr:PEP/pyruvate-binding domain-containing protein [Verrucomicrobiota bacterium]
MIYKTHHLRRTIPFLIGAIFVAGTLAAQLQVIYDGNSKKAHLHAKNLAIQTVTSLHVSDNLRDWFPVAASREPALDYTEPVSATQRFFKLRDAIPPELKSSTEWKTGINLPADAFLVGFKAPDNDMLIGIPGSNATQTTQWVKFTILMENLSTVYFQDGNKLPFHYEFATRHVPKLDGMTHQEFDAATLFHSGRQAVMGAVLYSQKHHEYAIQFVSQDRLPAPMLAFLWQQVNASIAQGSDPGKMRGLYMPTHEQSDTDGSVARHLAAFNVPVVSAQHWETGTDAVYALGWTMGRLVYVPGNAIAGAFRSGTLRHEDVLLTDHVPPEIPRVAGLITLHPSTPNAHVAILAKNFGIPFYYESSEATRNYLMTLLGREVMVRTSAGWGINQSSNASAMLTPLEEDLPSAFRKAIAQLKIPSPLQFKPRVTSGALTLSVASLNPTDIDKVGGKAAHFSFLSDTLPDNVPDPAIAITFDLWDAFLAQKSLGGMSLRETIQAQLAEAHQSGLQADLSDALKSIRSRIRDGVFTTEQRQAIINALSVFDPARKIRFRSSTNLEDSRQFTGAGLYDSYSGCLLDNLDNDTNGPCACDPEKQEERGVYRAIKKVYASLYNENAYLERHRFGVMEEQVGMAILVHHSFPDAIEWANGVALSSYSSYGTGSFNLWTDLATQSGATSVTNPDENAIPETVAISYYKSSTGSSGRTLRYQGRSSLLQVGREHVMDWQKDYENLHRLIERVAPRFARYATQQDRYTLDFEYKKVAPGELVIKQVRELPMPDALEEVTPILAGGHAMLRLLQGEARGNGGVFAYHRLKSIWELHNASRVLDSDGQSTSLFRQAAWTRAHVGSTRRVDGGMAGWPSHRFFKTKRGHDTVMVDRWEETVLGETTTYELSVTVPRWLPDRYSPIVFLDELQIHLKARYASPRTTLQINAFTGESSHKKIKEEEISLTGFDPKEGVTDKDLPQTRIITGKGGKRIRIHFYWPPHPTGPTAGYTAPLKAWKETIITGLTTQPITLRGYYSQTYAPGHHNFWEEYLFEPSLEEEVDPALLDELEAANIRQIYINHDRGGSSRTTIIGFDGQTRLF